MFRAVQQQKPWGKQKRGNTQHNVRQDILQLNDLRCPGNVANGEKDSRDFSGLIFGF